MSSRSRSPSVPTHDSRLPTAIGHSTHADHCQARKAATLKLTPAASNNVQPTKPAPLSLTMAIRRCRSLSSSSILAGRLPA